MGRERRPTPVQILFEATFAWPFLSNAGDALRL